MPSELPSQLNGLGTPSHLPEQVSVLTGVLRFIEERLTIGAGRTFSPDVFIGAINATNPANSFTSSYAVADLFASYEPSENFTLAANVNDLFVSYPWALTLPSTVACTPSAVTRYTRGWDGRYCSRPGVAVLKERRRAAFGAKRCETLPSVRTQKDQPCTSP